MRSVYFLDTMTGWAAGDGGHILKTTDGGATWNILSNGIIDMVMSISFVNSNIGWAIGSSGAPSYMILKTTDGGLN
ncbi:MAG: glycosyl hydrolase, partial [Aliifodinibius sp.]|nr:glycosyl hydrolase [Fodinibius sp.]